MKLPENLELEASNITVKWFRATIKRKLTYGTAFGDMPQGTEGWCRWDGPSWLTFIPDEHGGWPTRTSVYVKDIEVDVETSLSQTYILPDSCWDSISSD